MKQALVTLTLLTRFIAASKQDEDLDTLSETSVSFIQVGNKFSIAANQEIMVARYATYKTKKCFGSIPHFSND